MHQLNAVFNVPIMSTIYIVLSIDILEIILKLQTFTMKHNCKITTLLLIQESALNNAASEILGLWSHTKPMPKWVVCVQPYRWEWRPER